RLCERCKRKAELPDHALLAEGFTEQEIAEGLSVYEAVGCDECTGGYKGRTGVYQVMPMSEEIATIILQGGNAIEIARAAQAAGVRDLRQSALLKVKQGITILAEINRVTKDSARTALAARPAPGAPGVAPASAPRPGRLPARSRPGRRR